MIPYWAEPIPSGVVKSVTPKEYAAIIATWKWVPCPCGNKKQHYHRGFGKFVGQA